MNITKLGENVKPRLLKKPAAQIAAWQGLPISKLFVGHDHIDIEDKFPPSLPLPKGVPRFAGFGKEGFGEILEEEGVISLKPFSASICENLHPN